MSDSLSGSLSPDLLERIRSRASTYDTENRFFDEDLDELVTAGYLRSFVPTDMGGLGLDLVEVSHQQRRLAGASGSTALAVNMHLVWTGVARLLHDRGDSSLDFVLRDAAAGRIFAFGVSEPANDLVLFGSNSEARPDDDGGYRFHGTKIFTSLSPAWTDLGTMGLDTVSDDAPQVVYGFIERANGGFTIKDDWDTVGMRASQSCTTILEGAHAPHDRVVRRLTPGPNADPFIFGIFSMFELLLASVYTGIAERALDLAVEAAEKRRSKQRGNTPQSQNPDVRRRLAEAWLALDAIPTQIDAVATDVTRGVDHGALWFPKLSATKIRATETARDVVDASIRVAGGSSFFTRNELSRLYRDVLAGIFHPSSTDSALGSIAQALLGPIEG